MPTVAFNKFNCLAADMPNKVHNLSSDQLTVFLTDSAPVATYTTLANITEISYSNLSSRNITTTSSAQSSGNYKLIVQQLTLTASGTVPQFRYIGIYNSTAASHNLIGWYDYGSEINMIISGDTLPIAFDLTNGIFGLA